MRSYEGIDFLEMLTLMLVRMTLSGLDEDEWVVCCAFPNGAVRVTGSSTYGFQTGSVSFQSLLVTRTGLLPSAAIR